MEKNDNYSPLVKEYLDGFFMGFYKSLPDSYTAPISTSISKLDELGVLPKNDIDYLTSVFKIYEVEIICYKESYKFDNEYCANIDSIIKKIKNNKRFIDDNTLMEYIKEALNMQYGFERYISESEDFRTFIYELAEKNNRQVFGIKSLISLMINYITAYAYYYDIDKDIIRKLAIIFMCNYQEVYDTLMLNGFEINNVSMDQKYFETLITLIMKCSRLNEDKNKVIS